MASGQMLLRRMKRELEMLSKGVSPGVAAWPRNEGERVDLLDAEITGAAETPYEGGVFRLEVQVPREYPLKPPRVRFLTKIYHPNIDSQGRICLDTLNMPPKGAWKPALNIATLLTTIQALMSAPNPDDGLMADITDEYRRNPAQFRRTAIQWTARYARVDGAGASADHEPEDPDGLECVSKPHERTLNDIHNEGSAADNAELDLIATTRNTTSGSPQCPAEADVVSGIGSTTQSKLKKFGRQHRGGVGLRKDGRNTEVAAEDSGILDSIRETIEEPPLVLGQLESALGSGSVEKPSSVGMKSGKRRAIATKAEKADPATESGDSDIQEIVELARVDARSPARRALSTHKKANNSGNRQAEPTSRLNRLKRKR